VQSSRLDFAWKSLSRFSSSLHFIRVTLILLANMKASSHGLIRSSSVTFSIAPQPDIRDHLCDDMTIAQELLIGPKPPRRSNSFTGLSLRDFDSSNDNPSSTSPIEQTEDRPTRRVLLTSNTWTTSSGDVLSDQDEVDDRTIFIQEYNRLANKVRTFLLSILFPANQLFKHGVRPMVPVDYEPFTVRPNPPYLCATDIS
jgi:hypothetical protein